MRSDDTKGLKAFSEEYPQARLILVAMEPRARMLNNVEVYPIMDFLKKLWGHKIFRIGESEK